MGAILDFKGWKRVYEGAEEGSVLGIKLILTYKKDEKTGKEFIDTSVPIELISTNEDKALENITGITNLDLSSVFLGPFKTVKDANGNITGKINWPTDSKERSAVVSELTKYISNNGEIKIPTSKNYTVTVKLSPTGSKNLNIGGASTIVKRFGTQAIQGAQETPATQPAAPTKN
jgi:hypothetical protein